LTLRFCSLFAMRLCHPPDGSTSPKYKLLCFITTKFFCKEKNTLAFNRDTRCHLVLYLRLIPFHLVKHLEGFYLILVAIDKTSFYFDPFL
jgi:hypothetical protein